MEDENFRVCIPHFRPWGPAIGQKEDGTETEIPMDSSLHDYECHFCNHDCRYNLSAGTDILPDSQISGIPEVAGRQAYKPKKV